jgi:hypothetical protein
MKQYDENENIGRKVRLNTLPFSCALFDNPEILLYKYDIALGKSSNLRNSYPTNQTKAALKIHFLTCIATNLAA